MKDDEKRKAKAEYMREWRAANPEKYAKNLARARERLAERKESDPEFKRKEYERSRDERRARYKTDPEYTARAIQHSKNAYRKVRTAILEAYGGKCACCGEAEPTFLEIDHAQGGGSEHYRNVNAYTAYRQIIKDGFPDRFQLLCCNCNRGRARHGGICPHKLNGKRLSSSEISDPE